MSDALMSEGLPGAVLFVCSENAIRSPMAEALYKNLFSGKSYVQSAGIRRGEINPFMREVMAEKNIDLSHHQPKTLSDLSDNLFDIIITLSPEAHHQALELTRTMAVDVEYWPIMDPTLAEGNRNQRLDAFRTCRDHLTKRIKQRFGLSLEKASPSS